MRKLPFGAGEFDAAVSVAAIDHLSWPDLEQATCEAARVLKPGGRLLVVSLNPDAWVRIAFPPSIHGQGYWGRSQRRESWRGVFERCAFDVEEVGTAPATLYWLAVRRPAVP
jgi:ubiquinone/menaquinone biosynthesis C-methylase UbiE